VSPDGGRLAFFSTTDDKTGLPDSVIMSLPDGDPVRHLTVQVSRGAGGAIDWMPDGRGLTYVTDDNIWMQLIDGGAPKQLTHFTDGRRIVNYAWSRDGKRLAMSRAITLSDIVMLEGVK
jgi:Tol biopolymer transport system component